MFIVIREKSCELRRSGIKYEIRCRSSGAHHVYLFTYYKHLAPPEPGMPFRREALRLPLPGGTWAIAIHRV